METSKSHSEKETRREVGVDPLPADTLLVVTLKLNDIKVVLRRGLTGEQMKEIAGAVSVAIVKEAVGDA